MTVPSLPTYTYDEYGNKASITYSEGNTVIISYKDDEENEIAWPASETSGEGFKTKYEYDDNGNLIRTILDGGETTWQVYDYAGRMTKNVPAVLYDPSMDNDETDLYTGDHGYRYTYSPSG